MDKSPINQNYSYPSIDIIYSPQKQNQKEINKQNLQCNFPNSTDERNIDSIKLKEIANFLFDKKNIFSNSNSNSFSENLRKHLYYLDSNKVDFTHLNSPKIKFEINIMNNNQNNTFLNLSEKKSLYFCKICSISFTRKDNLQRHIKTKHSNFTGTTCKFCNKKIIRINEHNRKVHHRKNLIKINKKRILFKIKKVDNSKGINSPNKSFILSTGKKLNFCLALIDTNNAGARRIEDFFYFDNFEIGSGGTMSVYYGIEKNKKYNVAIKIDNRKKKKVSLF